jgi:hypothetical protein
MPKSIDEVFYSKRDWWANLMVWGSAAVCWVFAAQVLFAGLSQEQRLWEGLAIVLAGMGAPWFWLTTRYKLNNDSLFLQSGPFFKRIYYFAD